MATNFILGYCAYQALDRGLTNVLGVETLAHGTNLFAYPKILYYGGAPRTKEMIGTSLLSRNNKSETLGWFYLFREHHPYLAQRLWPREFVWTSSVALVCKELAALKTSEKASSFFRTLFLKIFPFFNMIVVPTLHFRFLKKEITKERFKEDEFFGNEKAYKTNQLVEAWRIGPIGTLIVGLNQDLVNRVQENPMRLVKGAVQLTGASLLAWYSYPSIQTVSFIAGALLS